MNLHSAMCMHTFTRCPLWKMHLYAGLDFIAEVAWGREKRFLETVHPYESFCRMIEKEWLE